MKKTASLVLLVCIISFLLSGCDVLDDIHSVKLTGNTGEIKGTVLPFYRAGSEVVIRTHKIICAGLYVFVNGEEVPMEQDGSDHWVYRFTMPDEDVTVHISHNPYDGRDEYEFGELVYWARFIEEGLLTEPISRISLTVNDINDETAFIEHRYSSKQEDIDAFLDILDQRLVVVRENIDSEVYRTYSVYCGKDEHKSYAGNWYGEICFKDGYVSHYYNETSLPQLFRFENSGYTLPAIDNPDIVTYSFKNQHGIDYVKKYGSDDVSIRFDNLIGVEFVPYDGEPIEAVAEYYLDTSHGRINLLTPTVFEIEGNFYEIVFGEKSWAYNACIKKGEK